MRAMVLEEKLLVLLTWLTIVFFTEKSDTCSRSLSTVHFEPIKSYYLQILPKPDYTKPQLKPILDYF